METSTWIALIVFILIILLLIGGVIWYLLEYQPETFGKGQGSGGDTGPGTNAGVTGPTGSFVIQSQIDNQYLGSDPSGNLTMVSGNDPSQVAVFITRPGKVGTYYVAIQNVPNQYLNNVIGGVGPGGSLGTSVFLRTPSYLENNKFVSQWNFKSHVFHPANPRSATSNRIFNGIRGVRYGVPPATTARFWDLINTTQPTNN